MTTVLFSWGRKPLAVDLEGWDVETLPPPALVHALDDPRGALLDALDSPDGLPGFEEWIRGAGSVAVVLPDVPDSPPWPDLGGIVIERVLGAGVEAAAVRVVIATGAESFRGWKSHPLAHLRGIEGVTVAVHDARDGSRLAAAGEIGRSGARSVTDSILGEVVRIASGQAPSPSRVLASTSAGGRRTVSLSRDVLEADRVIVVSWVRPDPLAGFSSSVRSILPGVSDEASALANEDLALLPMVGPGRVEGNPAREEMEEAASLLGDRLMAVDVVPVPGGGIAAVAAGEAARAGRVLAPVALEAFVTRCRPAPSVVASARVETLEALVLAGAIAASAVQTSGMMLVAGECPAGAGSPARVRRLFETVLLPRLAGAAVLFHTPHPPREMLAAGLRPVRSVPSALELMRDRAGGEGRLIAIPDASWIVPRS